MKEIVRCLIIMSFAVILVAMAACSKPPAEENTNVSNTNQSTETGNKLAPGTILAEREEQKAKRNPSQPGKGTIKVDSQPAGAAVLLIVDEEGGAGDPQPRGVTPTVITDVVPGKYAVHLEMPGYKFFQKTVDVKPGIITSVYGKLKKQ